MPPFDPRRHPRSDRYRQAGKLRPLRRVLLASHSRRLQGRITNRRPLRCRERWLPFYTASIDRNGHQARRREELFARIHEIIRRERALQHPKPADRHPPPPP